jgi:hypothetical protein
MIKDQIINQRGNSDQYFPPDFSETEKRMIVAVEKYTMKAIDDFIKDRKLKLFLSRIDYTGRLAIKIA